MLEAQVKRFPLDVEVKEKRISFSSDTYDKVSKENPFAEAEYLARVMGENKYTQGDMAEKIGKSNGYVSYKLGLLKLPDSLKRMLVDGSLKEMYARELVKAQLKGASEKILLDLAQNARGSTLAHFQERIYKAMGLPAGGQKRSRKSKRVVNAALRSPETIQKVIQLLDKDIKEDDLSELAMAEVKVSKEVLTWVMKEEEEFPIPFFNEDNEEIKIEEE